MKNWFIGLILIALFGCSKNDKSPQESPVNEFGSIIMTPADYQFPQTDRFSVLSWNVEHFVDAHDNPYIDNRRENNPPDNMAERTTLLLKALEKVNADIVILQEFENAAFLEKLVSDSLPRLDYRFFADAPSPDWYMNVVLMSKFPLGVLRTYGDVYTPVLDSKDSLGRTETQHHINTRMWTVQVFPSNDYNFYLTGVHLKAGRGARNSSMRKGQITLLLNEFEGIISTDANANLMVAGDFNAYPASEEMKILVENVNKPELTFTTVADTALFSHPADSPARRLDYVLTNESMQAELIEDSGQIYSIFSPDSMRKISDHLPVYAEFYREDKND